MNIKMRQVLMTLASDPPPPARPICAPLIPPGVVPDGASAPVLAMDYSALDQYATGVGWAGFPGFPYLANLTTRVDYINPAQGLAVELTREWGKVTSAGESEQDAEKIAAIEAELQRLNLRQVIYRAAITEAYFGRVHIVPVMRGANDDPETPLILSPTTVARGSLKDLRIVEPMWTTPQEYDARDPMSPSFYKPLKWWMMGKSIHASRMITVICRELPDLLKPAYNFAGMSLSQIIEPYVNGWLRTKQAVENLIDNFSTTILKTQMSQILQGGDDADADAGQDLIARAKLFTSARSNLGLMLLDQESETIEQINTPLSGLHELQAQSLEHVCTAARMPALILTGLSPSGLNASGEEELTAWHDWVAAQQEAHWRDPIVRIIKLVQLSLFGEIDDRIGWTFNPMRQMSAKELSEIRESDARAAQTYYDLGAIGNEEIRTKLARDPESGFYGIDPNATPVIEDDPFNEPQPGDTGAIPKGADDPDPGNDPQL